VVCRYAEAQAEADALEVDAIEAEADALDADVDAPESTEWTDGWADAPAPAPEEALDPWWGGGSVQVENPVRPAA
jgi:hypothetical protein